MHQPTHVSKQSAQTVITDLEAQKARLTEAISWTRNVAKGIGAAGRHITFSNAGPIEPDCREVGIVFSLAFVMVQFSATALRSKRNHSAS